MTAINLAKEIAESFERGKCPVTVEALCRKLDIPSELGDRLLGCLIGAGLIARTQEPAIGLVPAKSPDQIKLSDITEAVATAALAQPRLDEHGILAELVRAQGQLLGSHRLKDICDLKNEPVVAPTASPASTPNDLPVHER